MHSHPLTTHTQEFERKDPKKEREGEYEERTKKKKKEAEDERKIKRKRAKGDRRMPEKKQKEKLREKRMNCVHPVLVVARTSGSR